MATNENLIPIPGRLHSVATEGHVAGADEIIDDNLSKDQQTINAEVNAAIGTGGSVDSRIAAAVSAAKTELIGGASTDYNTLGKVEGKIGDLEDEVAYIDDSESSPAVVPGFDPTTDTVHVTAQTLSEQQKAQVRTNIGLGDVDARISNAVASEASQRAAADITLQSNINAKADKATTLAGYGITDAYTKSETYTKTEVNGLVDTPHQEYVTVDAYASLPATGSKDTIYRVSNYNGSTSQVDASVYSEYAWNGSQYIFLCVKSQIGEVFDISVYNNNAKYADLAAALNGGANIPQSLQKGGISVKFVCTYDNNSSQYVQYRYMGTATTGTPNPFLDTANWQGVDDVPTAGSKNLVASNGIAQALGVNNITFRKGVIHQTQGFINTNYTIFIYSEIINGPFEIIVNNDYWLYDIWEFSSESATTGSRREFVGSSTDKPKSYTVTSAGLYRICVQKTDSSNFTFDANNVCTENVISKILNGLALNIDKKQDKLVSGTNIKTVNGNSVVGSGDIKTGLSYIEISQQLLRNGEYQLEFTEGACLNKSNGLPTTYASGKYTEQYYKLEAGTYHVNFGISGNSATVCFYDKDQMFITDGYIQTDNDDSDITIPSTAEYVRFSSVNNTTYGNTITLSNSNKDLSENIERLSESISDVVKSSNNEAYLLPKADLSVVDFQFDWNDNAVIIDQSVVALAEEKNIKVGFALGNRLFDSTTDKNIINQYLNYQERGHSILNHPGTTAITLSNFPTPKDAYDHMIVFQRNLISCGFKPYGFVASQSSFDKELILAVEAVWAYGSTYYDNVNWQNNTKAGGPYLIRRSSLEVLTRADCKRRIIKAISDKTYMSFYGHVYNMGTSGASINSTLTVQSVNISSGSGTIVVKGNISLNPSTASTLITRLTGSGDETITVSNTTIDSTYSINTLTVSGVTDAPAAGDTYQITVSDVWNLEKLGDIMQFVATKRDNLELLCLSPDEAAKQFYNL